ncbi:MAG: prepilin-type N-terminal cleavage/methylation domain-containing protein [Candidatus Margulisbacteria bacterium]|nr:prepilin-type N-terminal cleavage/methylation domain-containing protein [Candidatus Margulisiibacteriota bacterium]
MKRGMTLIESIMVVILMGIMAFVFSVFILEGADAWRFITVQNNLALSSRAAVYIMAREIKRIKDVASLTTYASTEVAFTDVDNNPVAFRQSGAYLMRNSDVLLKKLKFPGGLFISYLNASGHQTATRDEIRTINIHVIVEDGTNRFIVDTAARLRNL